MRFGIHLILTLLLVAAGVPVLHAGTWDDANAAFAAGDYAKAAPLYQETIDREGFTAARLFNLGNAYAKLNQTGPAVLCYERAALLAPRDADIRANLKLIRSANTAMLEPVPPLWRAPLFWLSLHEWSWLAAVGLVFLTAAGLSKIFPVARPVWLQRAAVPLVATGLALALPAGMALQQRGAETHLAILTASKPVLRLSPFPTADPVDASPLLPGQRVIPGERHGQWVHLSLPGSSTTGWVPDKDIALIIPAF